MKKLKSSIDALHRTAQHSTARHGTARHGTDGTQFTARNNCGKIAGKRNSDSN